jgi:hypothetical protein
MLEHCLTPIGGEVFRIGSITHGDKLPHTLKGLPKHVRRSLPILSANTSPLERRPEFSASSPAHIGWGIIFPDRVPGGILTFRFQIGAYQVYWLADSGDPEVRSIVRTWAKERHIAVTMNVNGCSMAVSRNYRPDANVERFFSWPTTDSQDFVRNASAMIQSNLVSKEAYTDIPSVPVLQHVDVFILATAQVRKAFDALNVVRTSA